MRSRRYLKLVVPAALALLNGCPRPAPPPGTKSVAPKTAEAGPKGVNSKGITINWQERAGKTGVRRVMDLQAETGTLDKNSQSGKLNRASGVFYRDNKPKARFSAPIVKAAQDQKSVMATGGVTIVTVDPPGITLKAEKVLWRVEQDEIVATNSVRFVYQPPGENKPVGTGGPFPRAVINTRLSTLHLDTEQSLAKSP